MRLSTRTARAFLSDCSGSFVIIFVVLFAALMAVVALAVDYSYQSTGRDRLQQMLDASVLAGASVVDGSDSDKISAAEDHFSALTKAEGGMFASIQVQFSVRETLTVHGSASADIPLLVSGYFFDGPLQVGVESDATAMEDEDSPCIYVLGNQSQALLLNSGAKISAPGCQIHVHSTQNPAFIMNSGVTLDIEKLCVAGSNYIRNGGTVTAMETGCDVADDPYAGKLSEPSVPAGCTTSGAYNPGSYTLNPGVHCGTIFNGTSTVTFKPGLHIIKGSVIVNSGSTINAEGVTFYFPDANSKIQANGALTMTATAPTSGTYKGILMFEKTSGTTSTGDYVFNGSLGERLEGLIYLPNRNVTYNSTTNVTANNVTYVFNTLIVNSANWKLENSGASSPGRGRAVRLQD